jgi:hypothetical protein
VLAKAWRVPRLYRRTPLWFYAGWGSSWLNGDAGISARR